MLPLIFRLEVLFNTFFQGEINPHISSFLDLFRRQNINSMPVKSWSILWAINSVHFMGTEVKEEDSFNFKVEQIK